MSSSLDTSNHSALQFNLESAGIMGEICKPLLKKGLGPVVFTYCRLFNNGTRLYLCSCPDWVKFYVEHKFQDDVVHQASYAPDDDISYSLWTGFEEDKVYRTLRNRFKRWNGFTIYERQKDYVDSFDFTAHRDWEQVVNYYINNVDVLYSFINNFKKTARELIDPSDRKKLMVSKNWKPFHEMSKNSLLDLNKTKKFMSQTKLTI